MSFYIGLFAWFFIAAVLTAGVIAAANGLAMGVPLLVGGVVVFMAGFIKFGCLTH